MASPIHIPLKTIDGSEILLKLYEESPDTLFVIDEAEAKEYGESKYQLCEGRNYEFSLPEGYSLEETNIIRPSKIDPSKGRICTGNYVGTLEINLFKDGDVIATSFNLEIRSVKTNYRSDYRKMLEDITAKCTELILQHSDVTQKLKVDPKKDAQTLYQRYAFVDSLLRSQSFDDALHRVLAYPVKKWETYHSEKDIFQVRRFSSSTVKQLITRNNRSRYNESHPLMERLGSLPNKIEVADKIETVDIPENRFIKYLLETFLHFCLEISRHRNASKRLKRDAEASIAILDKYLSWPLFKEVSKLDFLPLNSPVLQRKEGYRELLQFYLMFDMVANLVWEGGEDIYKGGKKDVAVLYEYWLFFKLLDLITEVFGLDHIPLESIFDKRKDGLELSLKQGRYKVIKGKFISDHRELELEFCYNRTFTPAENYPQGGTWTRNMRPDYTLTIWPHGIPQEEAEIKEQIVHIHFDAKYKVDAITDIMGDASEDEVIEAPKGDYKYQDLLKMHAYKDAIRRTAGAYILYPGTEKKEFRNFHELLPGLGAFAISPSNDNNNGFKRFLNDVIKHFLNRASQRELHSFWTYDTFKEKPEIIITDKLPEYENELPIKTFVLVGYYKHTRHLNWIVNNKLYNVRTGTRRGSINISPEMIGAKYLILHGPDEKVTNKIYRLDERGPRIFAPEDMQKKNYPSVKIDSTYIVYSIKEESFDEVFEGIKWDMKKVQDRNKNKDKPDYADKEPFFINLAELMDSKA